MSDDPSAPLPLMFQSLAPRSEVERMVAVACPCCGNEETTLSKNPLTIDQVAMLLCDACGARVIWGKPLPRIVVEPYTDERGVRWVRRRFQNPATREDIYVVDIDPQLAASEAKNILSLVIP